MAEIEGAQSYSSAQSSLKPANSPAIAGQTSKLNISTLDSFNFCCTNVFVIMVTVQRTRTDVL